MAKRSKRTAKRFDPIKKRLRISSEPEGRKAPNTAAHSKSYTAAEETEVARLTRENARLVGELHENLQQRTAIASVLSIISRSAFDLTNVLNMVLELAARLAEADKGVILRASGDNPEPFLTQPEAVHRCAVALRALVHCNARARRTI